MKTAQLRKAVFLPGASYDVTSLDNAVPSVRRNKQGTRDRTAENMQQYTGSNSTISDLFDLDKRKVDGSAIHPCAVYNLRQSFEYVCDTFASEARAKNIELSFAFDEDISVAYWDMHSLRVLVLNKLISDAIADTPKGGKVAVCFEKSSDYMISIKVSDSGSGISAAEGESLFCEQSGRLYHAQLCVQAHKGEIGIVDDAGGTTFKIDLPLYVLCMQ